VNLGTLLGGLFPELDRPLRGDDSAETLAGWDSVRHTEIILSVEEAFGVDLTTREIGEATSVAALAGILRRRGLAVEI
jgi:acyl carrier protein